MDFKSKKIKKKNQLAIPKPKLKTLVIIALVIILPLLALAGFKKFILENKTITSTVLQTVGKPLPVDVNGYTNFLLLGTGDETHSGNNLTDTIILASLHQKNKTGVLVSLPRDLFVKHPDYYGQKINSIYASALIETEDKDQAYQVLEEVVEDVTNRQIHRRLRVNFSTFENIVDLIGGVTVNVKEKIYDTTYPTTNYGYQIFSLEAGLQNIDGATALKYARSRHTTSDFDRSRRQQEILFAIKEKAAALGILKSPGKIKDIYEELQNGIDTNLDVREMIELAGIGLKFDRSKLTNLQLHDDPVSEGGFLVAPPREAYGGIFVLRPLGDNFEHIHRYINLHSQFSEIMSNPPTLQILNGTKIPYFATNTKLLLQRYGFETIRFGNAENRALETTTLYKKDPLVESNFASVLDFLVDFTENDIIPAEYQIEPYLSEADYILELGSDFQPSLDSLKTN